MARRRRHRRRRRREGGIEWDSSREWPERWVKMSLDSKVLESHLSNYRWIVQDIIPRAAWRHDPDATDEISLLLFTRDDIEDALIEEPDTLRACLQTIQSLDESLLAQRSVVVSEIAWYGRAREKRDRPKAHWWWYLDQIPGRQCSQCQSPMETRLTSITLGSDGTASLDGLIVHVCSHCGEKRLPRLSLEILMERINQALPPVISDPQFLPEEEISEPAIVAPQVIPA